MDSRKTLFGAGGSIMTLSIGLFASGWPTFITAHSWIVWTGFALGFVLLASGFLAPAKRPGSNDSRSVSKNSGNQVGRDNTGKMFQAENLHYHEAPHAPPSPVAIPVISPPTFDVRSRFAFITYESSP